MSRFGVTQRGSVAIVLAASLALVAVIAASVLSLNRSVHGRVVDGNTNKPVAGALVKVADRTLTVDSSGGFVLDGPGLGASVVAEARGYQPVSARIGPFDGGILLRMSPRVLEGVISDAGAGKPLGGVQLSAAGMAAQTDPEGRFRFEGIDPGTVITASLDGFAPGTIQYDGQAKAEMALQPKRLAVTVLDSYTGKPVAGVQIAGGRQATASDAHGQALLHYLSEGTKVRASLAGFAPADASYTGQDRLELLIRPDTVKGMVKDPTGKPLAGAAVAAGPVKATTDDKGAFTLSGLPENARLSVEAKGYQSWQKELGRLTEVEVKLERPFAAKGLYLTFYGVGDEGLRENVLELADTTEINAVVIDVKGDRGWIAYKSSVPLVAEIGAQTDIMIPKPKEFLADLRKRGIYTIARIVTFKDTPLSTSRPDLAVKNSSTGRPWVDNEGLTWTDATRPEVWDYNIALAVEAIELGFDEIQFDYVRFPTDAGAGNALSEVVFSKPNTMENRMAAINGFLEKARDAIHARGGKLSADIFGYVVLRDDDMGIGQRLEEVAKRVDYVSPMVYPNLFWDGIDVGGEVKWGGRQSGHYPYEIVYESMKKAASRVGAEKLRPWLQYYNDYITGKPYTAQDMRLQIQATYDNGIPGWLFWDPINAFSKGGFNPE